jgi:DNA segregation ATPase FtsK/SpoIIIE, S-DNA-T family
MAKNRKVKRAPAKTKKASRPRASNRHEIIGIVALGIAIFAIAATASLQLGTGDLMGPFGRTAAGVAYGLAGVCSYVLAAGLAVLAVRLLMERLPVVVMTELAGVGLGLVSLTTLLHLIGSDYRVAGHGPGGLLGEHVAEVLRAVISTAGTALVAVVGLVCAVVVATPLRMRTVLSVIARAGTTAWAAIAGAGRAVGGFCGEVITAILPERERYYEDELDYADEYDAYELEDGNDPAFVDPPIIDQRSGASAAPIEEMAGDTEKIDEDKVAARIAEIEAEGKPKTRRKKPKKGKKTLIGVAAAPDGQPEAPVEVEAQEVEEAAIEAEVAAEDSGREPVIVESKFRKKDSAELAESDETSGGEKLDFIPLREGAYQLPPTSILTYDESQTSMLDKSAMLELSAKLTQTLENYGVKGEVVAIRPGPVVTMYEFAPAPGTRLNKIVNLTDDLAMSLEALRVRIVAPIPGKAAVGIEVPNDNRETVYFKEIIVDDGFKKSSAKLPLALGKDIEGAPVTVDLAKMPHLLVAGTTGSGKSVSVNSMITSLLYHSTPEQVRMIMVDPKMLELSIYEGIPHLLLPVVTDPQKANLALRWAVDEMERRYELLAGMGVRDIASYNKKLEKLRAKWEADKLRKAAEEAERLAEEGDLEVTEEREPPRASDEPPRALPFIVVVIDEFADLMMCAPKEVETSVARIAQKARAAGIHLILATQRPSVNVITGLIKANFPSRIAFHVTAKVDSRTILDQGGAEALLGAGDMLFSDRGAAPRRLHGCFVDEDEIHRVVDFLKEQGKPVYNMDILKPREDDGGDGDTAIDDSELDEMYDKAVALVAETRQVSISMIQRRLRVGYNRAARMVEVMERQGVVSPPDHTNKREVLTESAA